jgi:hypothetical protein
VGPFVGRQEITVDLLMVLVGLITMALMWAFVRGMDKL